MTKKTVDKQHGTQMAPQPPTMRMHLWLETGEGVLFGMGRLMLLREIERHGSLKAAAAELGMSYRGAWGKIKKTEELLGTDLIDRGNCRRSGASLTPFAHELVMQFTQWFREVEDFALLSSRRYLPFVPDKFSEDTSSVPRDMLD
jgi:molybdate transport system regulatory protein